MWQPQTDRYSMMALTCGIKNKQTRRLSEQNGSSQGQGGCTVANHWAERSQLCNVNTFWSFAMAHGMHNKRPWIVFRGPGSSSYADHNGTKFKMKRNIQIYRVKQMKGRCTGCWWSPLWFLTAVQEVMETVKAAFRASTRALMLKSGTRGIIFFSRTIIFLQAKKETMEQQSFLCLKVFINKAAACFRKLQWPSIQVLHDIPLDIIIIGDQLLL